MFVALDLGRAVRLVGVAQLAPHFPGHPDQQQPADEDQSDDLHQLGHDEREGDAQHQRREHADQDHLLALFGGQARGERAHDDRIVPGEHQVDHQHLKEGGKGRGFGDVREILDDRVPDSRRTTETARHGRRA